jgi:NADH-quinone oxidoreductase subunit N
MSAYTHLLQLAMPEVIVAITAMIVLTVDFLFLRTTATKPRLAVATGLAVLGCAGAIVQLALMPQQVNAFDGMLVVNPLTQFVQIALLALTIVTLLLAIGSDFTEHVGEFVTLVLFATLGMMFLASSQNLLTTFVALELLSLPLYVLTGFDKRNADSSEAALKYFFFGGMSAAFLLFGFSLLYGLANATSYSGIAAAIQGNGLNPLLVVAMVTTAIGLGFKVAAAPFHFWAPDVYEAAPMPVAAFIASGSKVASFYGFFSIFVIAFAGAAGSAAWRHLAPGWELVVAAVAVLSMLLGNMAAIAQRGLRRLLAYSAIAHAGYMLIAVVAHTPRSLAALLFYVVTYALATLGAFGVVGIVEDAHGDDRLASLQGLSRRAPALSLCLLIFILSLAGIPPLAGFFGKFYLFAGALAATEGLLWLVGLALAMSAVSLYYYLKVLKRVYGEGIETAALPVPRLRLVTIIALAAAVLLLGCAPNLLLGWILKAMLVSF